MSLPQPEWLLESDRKPTRQDGPMANSNKVQVEVLTHAGKVQRRNYFVADEPGGFDDYDLSPVRAWRPIPIDAAVEGYRRTSRY
jgi:hypothetical protein